MHARAHARTRSRPSASRLHDVQQVTTAAQTVAPEPGVVVETQTTTATNATTTQTTAAATATTATGTGDEDGVLGGMGMDDVHVASGPAPAPRELALLERCAVPWAVGVFDACVTPYIAQVFAFVDTSSIVGIFVVSLTLAESSATGICCCDRGYSHMTQRTATPPRPRHRSTRQGRARSSMTLVAAPRTRWTPGSWRSACGKDVSWWRAMSGVSG